MSPYASGPLHVKIYAIESNGTLRPFDSNFSFAIMGVATIVVVACTKPKPSKESTFDTEARLLIKVTAAPSTKKADSKLPYAHLIDSLGYERFAVLYAIEYRTYFVNGAFGTDDFSYSASAFFGIGDSFLWGRDTVNKKFIIWGDPVCRLDRS